MGFKAPQSSWRRSEKEQGDQHQNGFNTNIVPRFLQETTEWLVLNLWFRQGYLTSILTKVKVKCKFVPVLN
jgi:hypothetical protein